MESGGIHLESEGHRVVVLFGDEPLGITDVVVEHHTVPLTASHTFIIIVRQPLVLRHQVVDGQAVAEGGTVVDLRHARTGHRGVIHQLIERILCLGGDLFLQGLAAHRERQPELFHPQHFLHIVDAGHLRLGLAPEVVFRIAGDDVGRLLGKLIAEDAAGEAFEPCLFVAGLDGLGVPGVVHDERDGHLLGFQVAYVDDPDAVDAALIGKVELFAQFGDGGGVHPPVVPRTAVHVDVVVESESALALTLEVAGLAADVTPVVVAEEQRHVVGHGESGIVVALHLGEDGPELGHGVGTAVDILDDLALTFDHLAEGPDVLLVVALAHRHVAVATHADGHEVVVVLVALHALTEEPVDALLVRGIVPGSHLLLAMQILLMGAHHRLVVTGTHHDAHLVGEAGVLGIVLIEGRRPHGGPEVVGLQAQHQFEDMLVGLCVDASEMVRTPSAERGPLVVDEKAAILHLRGRLDDAAAVVPHFILMLHGHIGHPVPGRDADAA